MRAGTLRHRIGIHQRSSVRDASGGQSWAWSAIATRPAAAEFVRGAELVASQQRQARATYRFTLRFDPGLVALLPSLGVSLGPALRLSWQGRTFDVVSWADPDGGRRRWEVIADELVAESEAA